MPVLSKAKAFDIQKKTIMKTKTFALLVLLFTFFLMGCIPSIHPLYTDDELVFKNEILGSWHDATSEVEWIFEDSGENCYILKITEDNKPSILNCHLVKLGTNFFFDFFPRDDNHFDNISGYLSMQFIAVHTFAKVNITADSIEIYRFDPSWLEEILQADPNQVKHEKTGEYILLTASTEELQKFVMAYAELEEMYLEKTVIVRR